ncbi:hypothetical protein CR513_61999, partial [Mucuna pruriens]
MAEDKVITLGLPNLDSLIVTWLWNFKTLEISQNYMFYSSVHSTTCYDIESKIFNSRQGTFIIIKYYGTLNGLCIELDQYQGLKTCKADSIAYTALIERGRIFKFLHALNSKYNPIRVHILGKEKLPSLFESEETR